MNILLTGGTGYIGSHTAAAMVEADYKPVLFDNLSNSNRLVVSRLEKITSTQIPFIKGDIRDTSALNQVLEQQKIDAVVHFAGLKAVGESVLKPVEYYDNNVGGTISLLKAMSRAEVHKLVFSSSATVYGDPQYLPLDESHPCNATNPYGQTKLHIEQILEDTANSNNKWRISSLRYFNPVGAHPSGLIGENPNDIPNNLMPYIMQVAGGRLEKLQIFGDDYQTKDGTGVRDYIHITDLVEGHLAALQQLDKRKESYDVFNLGTGKGHSVLEMLKTFEKACSKTIPYKIVNRREGDVAQCYAEASKARKMLGWSAHKNIDEMCESAWNFQKNKPALAF